MVTNDFTFFSVLFCLLLQIYYSLGFGGLFMFSVKFFQFELSYI